MYDIRVDKSETCSVLCTQDLSPENADAFREKILNQYSVHLLADNLPVATKWELEGKGLKGRAGLLSLWKFGEILWLGFPSAPKKFQIFHG